MAVGSGAPCGRWLVLAGTALAGACNPSLASISPLGKGCDATIPDSCPAGFACLEGSCALADGGAVGSSGSSAATSGGSGASGATASRPTASSGGSTVGGTRSTSNDATGGSGSSSGGATTTGASSTSAGTTTGSQPTPALSSLSPTTALAGAASLELTLTGSRFATNALVLVGGQSLTPDSVSATRLAVALPPPLLAVAQNLAVAVQNPGGGTSNSLQLSVLPIVRTVLGGDLGDDGPALQASLAFVYYGAMAPDGTIYYPETTRHRVMRIDPAGVVHVVAGQQGICGYDGSGGPALSALMCEPMAVALDSQGNLDVLDQAGSLLRSIDSTGKIRDLTSLTNLNGGCWNSGDNGPSASATLGAANDLVIAHSGDIFIATCNQNLNGLGGCNGGVVREISGGTITTVAGGGDGGDGSLATEAALVCPQAVAVDPGETTVYIADFGADRVRAVNLGTGIIRTLAGTGDAGYSGDGPAKSASIDAPSSLALDLAGNVYVAAPYIGQILRVGGGNISLFAGAPPTGGPLSGDDGPATQANLGVPWSLFSDPAGDVYVFNGRLWESGAQVELRVIDDAGIVTPVAGLGPPPDGGPLGIPANNAVGVATDPAGDLFASASFDDIVWGLSTTGSLTVVAGNGIEGGSNSLGSATGTTLNYPNMLWYDPTLQGGSGGLLLADGSNGLVQLIDTSGVMSTLAGGGPWPDGCPGGPPTNRPAGAGPGYDCLGDDYLASQAVIGASLGGGSGGLDAMITDDDAGMAYLTEGDRVRSIDLATGLIETLAGSTNPAVDSCGDSGDNGPSTAALLCGPTGLAFDEAGDLWVADTDNCRLRKINLRSAPLGNIATVAGNGNCALSTDFASAPTTSLNQPVGLVSDGLGDMYVSEQAGDIISYIDSGGILHHFAGTSTSGFGGDGNAAIFALFSVPSQLALGPDPDVPGQRFLYVADYGNNRVRAIGPLPGP